ncbi:MAG: cobalamin-binding protein [Deltaproteobacteria bacterium CG_4_10_14_0_2_um_filter_43_8]|nr:MAG: cobalamin-binding protein [Deltaproteobacteria bacterium CG11_big_fil_rev_8_21_14_0_20_42_23]PJA21352.1 MAG: cobalamin-binding protein [Deltaproteobacteria bacterium CG_4_10_14_0_2_um_filter_43_8]PJC64812.1 MAG: cobalamin-binding protein [Deltaproteobacteria bacterium CG_4_9_14_0_2_um_filter_42_21]
MKVVSLIASSTEIICALGCKSYLVGRSHECDYPPEVKQLPLCTEVKFGTHGTSYEIDERVKAIVQEGLSVYRVKGDVLQKLNPDVIVTQTQCEVCAVSLKDVERATCDFMESKAKVVSLETNCLADLWTDIMKVADALDVHVRGQQLVAELQDRMQAIAKRTATLANKPSVACIEWVDPLMSAGNWMPELVEMAGGKNLFGEAGKHSPWMTFEDLVKKNPDIILIMPCGYDIKRSLEDVPLLQAKAEWKNLKSVKAGRVYVCDGNQYFNRPGPRLVESLEILAEIFDPDFFDFKHKGEGYVSVDFPSFHH